MPITFLDEEKEQSAIESAVAGEGGVQPLETEAVPTKNKITFLDEEEAASPMSGLEVPEAPKPIEKPPVVESIGQLQGITNAAMNAFDASRQSMAVAGGVSPEEAEEISRLEYQKEARRVAPAYQEYLDAGGMDAVKAFAKNPLEISTNIIAEGLAGSLYSLGAGLVAGGTAAGAAAVTGVGAPLAPAAFLGGQIGGTFAGSLAAEYGSKVLEELQNAGMDIKDPESIQKFFSDEKLVEQARTQGLKRGVPVAIFDGFSAGIAGRLARAPIAQALKKTPTRLAATEAGVQAGLGGGGEIAGALAAGEEVQPKAVFAEVLGEAGPAAAEITVGRIATKLAKTPEEKQFDQNVLAAQVATRASQDVAPATADALERQVQDTISETAETPEQRVARLEKEAAAAAGIELEVEGGGVEPPVKPAITPETIEPQPVTEVASADQPSPNLPPRAEAAVEARPVRQEGESIGDFRDRRDAWDTQYGPDRRGGRTHNDDGTPYQPTVFDETISQVNASGVIGTDEDAMSASIGTRSAVEAGIAVKDLVNAGWVWDANQNRMVNPQNPEQKPSDGLVEARQAPATVTPTTPTVTETRTVEDAIRDKDTFIYNGQRGAVSIEDGVSVFRPFGTQEKYEVSVNPAQKLSEIEGIEWTRKGQTRKAPPQTTTDIASVVETNPTITEKALDESESDFEVPAALVEIEKSQTLNDLADLFDTGESKISQEGKRAKKVSETPEFYRQIKPEQISQARKLIDSALRVIDALPITEDQKAVMADPFLLLDQDITDYENNPEYKRYKASIRTEVLPAGETGAFPETITEVEAGVRELEQRQRPTRTAAAKTRLTDRQGTIEAPRAQMVANLKKPQGTRVEAAAYIAPDGSIYFGSNHLGAMALARDAGKITQAEIDAKQDIASRETNEFGYSTDKDLFVTRDQAEQLGRESNQLLVKAPDTGKLHSNEIALDAFPEQTESKKAALPVEEPSEFNTASELQDAFERRGDGHLRFSIRLDELVKENSLTEDAKNLILAVIFDANTNDEYLLNMELGIQPKTMRSLGRGGVAPQEISGVRAGFKPLLILLKDLAKKYPIIAERTGNVLSTFWHEYGHAGYYGLLTPAQKKIVEAEYRKTTRDQRRAYFASGVAAVKGEEFYQAYYAKSETEWFAQSFAEYVLKNKTDQKKLLPMFKQLLGNFKRVFSKLFGRPEPASLDSIYEYILSGTAYGQKPNWGGWRMSTTAGGKVAKTVPAFTKRIESEFARRKAGGTPVRPEVQQVSITGATAPAPAAEEIITEDAKTQYAPKTEEEQKAFDKASSNKVLARNPQLAVAAVRMKNGEITAGEYADLVDAIDPFTAKGADPIPTKQKIQQYIAADKADQVMQPIESGKGVEFRIDIPTYNRSTAAGDPVYAVTAHEPVADDAKGVGKVISFIGVAKVNNPTFMTRAISGRGTAVDIAAGAGKFPLATVKGNYEPITDLPSDINDPNVWTEVGYNPIRSSFFVDVRSKDAVVGGSEAIMVGSRVFVKDAVLETRPTGETMGIAYEEAPIENVPQFNPETPEATTLKVMANSMAKVDAASEAKGPTTYKISEIASIWMDQGGDTRQLQDLITDNTNLTPTNAKRVANAIAKQYDIQQSIAEARTETVEGVSLEGLPEGVTIPKEADPKRPKTVIQRLIDVTTGVRVKPTMLTVNEKTALKDQIRLKAAATREAKKAQQETASEVVEVIKAMDLRGPVRPKQAQALAKRAAKVIWTSEKSVESFVAYAEKVMANTNYDADLREAKTAQKRAAELAKRKTIASPQREVLSNISKIGVNMLEDPREFAEVVNHYMQSFKPVVSPNYVVVPDSEMTSYLSQAEDIVESAKAEFDRVVTERLSEKYGVSPDKIQSILDAEDIERALTQYAKREVAEAILNEKAAEVLSGLRAYDQSQIRADQRAILDSILKLDPSLLSSQERQQFIRTGNNIIFNNQTNGAEFFAATAKGQQMAKEAASNEDLIAKNKAWVDVLPSIGSRTLQKTWRNWALELQSVADTFRNAFGKGSMAKVYRMMGMYDLDRGFTAAANTVNQIQEEVGAFYNKLEKKYKDAARNQDGILAEGIVGFLIQKVPEKGEVESLAQRRDLIQQDIRNRRISNDPDRVEMADRIEKILQQLDGESVADIMSNLKRDYRANHESLTWLKDQLLPKYKDFLKNFDENFNDQANNYENPDYLPIGFIRSGPSLAITPENEALYYEHVSLRPKQSSYTIKRADYTQLPTDKTTNKPKEIEFNLRRNTFDSLSDQVNKAYTSPAWQQIFAFMKTPESEKLFGGMANKEFFIERLNRLRLSRMRRGSMSSGYIEKTADALSVMARKIGTGIALGGFYQPAKQAPDQIIAVVGTTGRADLLAENMSPVNLKAAKAVLDKFSIGRRGDASSGYKYINQMEGAQNKIERYLSESKWDAAKEQAEKVADVWLLALKKTDYVFAAGAWMTYYRAQLAKDGVKFQGWEQESKLLDTDTARQDAAAYAEQMTDIYQGSSDPTKMATFVQSGKSGWENLFKAIFVPFNSFAVQQRMRMYSDARDALLKSGDDRVKGAFGLAATIGGLLAFHSVRRFALPALTGVGVSMLYAAFGVDMDEPDEEKQKEDFTKRWRQFLGEFTANLLVGGTGQIVEAATVDSFNYAAYLIAMQTEDETVLNDEGEIMSFSQYAKERSPFWRYRSFDNAMSLGMFDIGIDQGKKAILETKTLMTPEEMENFTTEEQRLLYFAAISDWLYLMRLNDADFSRMVDRARRDIVKRSKETEKELARIRAGR
jgi:hypothetical protein